MDGLAYDDGYRKASTLMGGIEFQPDDFPLLEEDWDVRTVTVVWADDEGEPEVVFSGCSPFEAIGLLDVGRLALAREFRARLVIEEDVDDDDSEPEA